ncbi:MAG: ATP-binding cassette domain-containing protein [Magnetococcus sp. WYHC-3]
MTAAPLLELPAGPRSAALTLAAGDSVALLSGEASGKTRLLYHLAGLENSGLPPALWSGRSPDGFRGAARPAHLRLWPTEPADHFLGLTGTASTALALGRSFLDPADLSWLEALQAAGLPPEAAQGSWLRLSGAERHRLFLAGVLLAPPRVLLVDEPGACLSESGETTLAQQLAHLCHSRGMALLLVTSRRQRAQLFAHRVLPLPGAVADFPLTPAPAGATPSS